VFVHEKRGSQPRRDHSLLQSTNTPAIAQHRSPSSSVCLFLEFPEIGAIAALTMTLAKCLHFAIEWRRSWAPM
jgi:hypothetical protein